MYLNPLGFLAGNPVTLVVGGLETHFAMKKRSSSVLASREGASLHWNEGTLEQQANIHEAEQKFFAQAGWNRG